MFDAYDTRSETDADGVGEGDVRRKGESDFDPGASLDGAVQVEKHTAGADVLCFGLDFAAIFDVDDGGEPHVKAPHRSPFL